MKKVCKACGIEKELSDFGLNKQIKDGYQNYCKECYKKKRSETYYKNKEKIKIYLKNNKEKISERSKNYHINYYKERRDDIIQYQKEYRCKNHDKKLQYEKEYRNKLENKERRSIYQKNRYKEDPLYKFSINIRNIIYKSFKNKGYSKKSKSQNILGCSFKEFKLHLESKFEDWMNWDNYGLYNGELNYGWDIDHVIPLSTAENEEEIYKLSHYTNLQPLCSKLNRDIKKDKIENPQ